MVGLLPLEECILVRVQVPQPTSEGEEVLSRARRSAVLFSSAMTIKIQGPERAPSSGRRGAGTYFVYIIECADGSLYTGITTDVARRFAEHKAGTGGHYTRSKEVVRVAYSEQHPDRSSASKREAEIKGWRRDNKLRLIQSIS